MSNLQESAGSYRLQFSSHFRLEDAERLVSYLDALGITTCYASPLLQASPGSSHGYDICDHGRLNLELGGEADFDAFSDSLRQRGIACDWREPNVIRAAPVPLYNTFAEVFAFADELRRALGVIKA